MDYIDAVQTAKKIRDEVDTFYNFSPDFEWDKNIDDNKLAMLIDHLQFGEDEESAREDIYNFYIEAAEEAEF